MSPLRALTPRTGPRSRRVLAALAFGLAVLAACESYLAEPGTEEATEGAPVLTGVTLVPDSVDITLSGDTVAALVGGRSRSGVDSASVVLVSPSGATRVRCSSSAPATGTAFDGAWECRFPLAPGQESGVWSPDSVRLHGALGSGTSTFTNADIQGAGYSVGLIVVGVPPEPTRLTLLPDSVNLPGATSSVTLDATVWDQYDRPMPGEVIAFASLDTLVARVDAGGTLTPVNVGVTAVTATSGALADTSVVVVPSTPTEILVIPASVALDSVGVTAQLSAALVDQFGDTLAATIVWSSADETVATVDAEGVVVATGPGITTVDASAQGISTSVLVTVEGGPAQPGNRWIALSGGSFTDPANWSRGTVPGPADTALVDLNGSYTVTLSGDASVAVLAVGNNAGRPAVRLQGGSLAVQDSAHFAPSTLLEIQGGVLTGPGTVVVEDSLVWSAGVQAGTGSTVIASTGVLVMPGTGTKEYDTRAIRVAGSASWTQGQISGRNGGELNIVAGASFAVSSPDTLRWTSGPYSRPRVILDGAVVRTGVGTITTFHGPAVTGSGSVTVQEGALRLGQDADVNVSGTWTVEAGAVLETARNQIAGPSVSFLAGSRVQGAGVVRVNGGTVGVVGEWDQAGTLELLFSSFSLQGAPGQLLRVNHVVLDGGSLSLPQEGYTLEVRETFTWRQGAQGGNGTLLTPAGTISQLTTTATKLLDGGARWVNGGDVTWTAGLLRLRNGGTVENGPTGVWQVQGDLVTERVQTLGFGAMPRIVNDGTIRKTAGAGSWVVNPTVVNRGLLESTAGTVSLRDTLDHQAGAVLSGTGSVDLAAATHVAMNGTLRPGRAAGANPATLNVLGNLALGGSSRVELRVGGTAGGTDSDLLVVSGALTLGGTLAVTGTGGYLPAAGDSVEVLRYASRSGSFAQVTGLDFGVAGGGEPMDTVFQAARMLLVAGDGGGPEPGAPTGWIAFTSDRDGTRDIWVKNVETGVVTQVANDGQFNGRPAFSPDGSRIAYADNARAIWVVNSDGTGATRVTDGSTTTSGASPTWSPDGTRIAYQSGLDGTWDIRIVTLADTANKVKLLESAAQEHYPAWSPDGTRIAYAEDQDRIVSVRVSDGGDRQVHYNFAARYPAWSPDGSEIAFSRAVVGGWEIAVVDVASGTVRSVVNDAAYNWYPEWSPDGAYIAYAKNPDFTGTAVWDLWARRSDGSGDQILIEASTFDDMEPSWTAAMAEPNGVPSVTVTSPADGAVFSPGATVSLQGSATDPEDGALTGASLAWSSSLDGPLGTGASLSVSTLSTGTHTLTLTATDSQGAAGSASVGITVGATADAVVAMEVVPDPVTVGDTLTHAVYVRNNGPATATGVEVTVLVEGDVLFASPNQEGCGDFFNQDPPRKLWVCNVGDVPPGGQATLLLRVIPQAAGTLTSTAEITGLDGVTDPVLPNNIVTATTTVQAPDPGAQADLSVSMTMEPYPTLVGGTVSHLVTVRNDGPAAVTGVELSVRVLGTVVFAAPNQEGCSDFTSSTPPSKLWVCAVGDLAAGAERTLLLRVVAQAEEMITTTAEITAFSGATDPDGGDQLVEGAVQVVPYPASTEVLFGVDSSNDALFRVDPLTGAYTRVGTSLGTAFSTPGALGMVPETEDLLVWTNSPEMALGTVNVCTGVGTVERTFGSVKPAGAMAVRSDGTVYVFAGDAQGNAVYRIDPPYTSVHTLAADFPIRAAGADFTGTGRLFAVDLTSGQPVRLVEVDPVTGEILQTINVRDEGGTEIATGVLGTMVWNPDTGQFLVTSIQSFLGQGRAFLDLSLEGVVSNVRTFPSFGWTGQGGQGMAFRSAPTCG